MTSLLTLDGVELPEDLEWADEYTAWKVGQVVRYSLTGALIVQEAALQAGRPVTLQSLELGGGDYAATVSLAVSGPTTPITYGSSGPSNRWRGHSA